MDFENFDGKKDIKSQVFEESCYQFLKKFHEGEIHKILQAKKYKPHYPIIVDYVLLHEDNPVVSSALLKSPEISLERFDKAAYRALLDKYEELRRDSKAYISPLKSKLKVHIRLKSLPVCEQLYRVDFPTSKEFGSFLCMVGTVVRVSTSKVLEYSKTYKCNRCKNTVQVKAIASRYHAFPRSVECPNRCVNAKVTPVAEAKSKSPENYIEHMEYQEIKLQEQVQKMDFGSMPKALTVVLEDDLVDMCKPGDDVAITGTLFLRWKTFKLDQTAESELVCRANNIQINNDQRKNILITEEVSHFVDNFWSQYQHNPFEGRNHIIASFCPQIYGMYVVKLAMCMVLAGGVSREVDGAMTRGDSHLLLVGDPGTGKSQLLKYASKISPRSVMTNGIGTSSAGLTVSAVKDNGEWHLEAGALVLANGGVCCIDEFSCIKEHDRISIHEAMEQQSISIAKAGMVVKVPTRMTMIAATNPKGKYDPDQPLSLNIAIASPLLSRFDVLLVLTDAQNDKWDSFICDFILEGKDVFSEAMKSCSDLWDSERLQSYLVHIKELKPEMTIEANEVISQYYQHQRRLENRSAARTTVRLLESLRRLSEGHARLMYRNKVLVHDAISAISLIEASMHSSAIVDTPNTLHTSFPTDPMNEYKNQAALILQKLDLEQLWERENVYLDSLQLMKPKPKGYTVVPGPSASRPKFTQCPKKIEDTVDAVFKTSLASQETEIIPKKAFASQPQINIPLSPNCSPSSPFIIQNESESEAGTDSEDNPSMQINRKRILCSDTSSDFNLSQNGSDDEIFGSFENEPLFHSSAIASSSQASQNKNESSQSPVPVEAANAPFSPANSLTSSRKIQIKNAISKFKRVRREDD